MLKKIRTIFQKICSFCHSELVSESFLGKVIRMLEKEKSGFAVPQVAFFLALVFFVINGCYRLLPQRYSPLCVPSIVVSVMVFRVLPLFFAQSTALSA